MALKNVFPVKLTGPDITQKIGQINKEKSI